MNILLFPALYLWMVLFNLRPIQSVDIWWHLASGRYMAQFWTVPRVDPFSLLCQGSPWVDSYWLFEIILFGFYRLTGLLGVILAKALFIPLILYIQDRQLQKNGVHWAWRLIALAGLFLSAHPRGYGWSEQASLVTFFFLSLLLAQLESFRRAGWTRAFWIWPVLFMLWANMHRGFVLGGVVSVCYLLMEKTPSAKDLMKRIGWLVLCGSATLATPYGLDLYRMIWHDFSLSPVHIAGWSHPPWGHLEMFWLSVILFWGTILWRMVQTRKRIPLPHLGVAVFLTWIGTRYVANIPYLMLFAWPFIAETLSEATPEATRLLDQHAKPVTALLLTVLIGASVAAPVKGGIHNGIFPIGACDFIQRENINGPFYNEYHFGGYWLWRFAGERPVFIDGRYPAVAGYQNLQVEIETAKNGSPQGWEKFLERAGVQAALIGYPRSEVFPSVTEVYFPRERWALVYWDDTSEVFLKRNAGHRSAIHRFAFNVISPDVQESYFLWRFREAPESYRRTVVEELKRNAALHPDSLRTRRLLQILPNRPISPE